MAVSSPREQSTTAALDAPIALVDLAAQQARIRREIDAAIARVLAHGGYILGPEVAELERQLAAFCGARHVVTCASGTEALMIVLMALGIGPGDAVICPSFTYPATPEAIAVLGATPVFADVRADTFNLDPARLEAAVAAAHRAGLKPRVVVPVDLFGLPADYDAIAPIAEKHGLFVLADAAQSFGAAVGGRKVGAFGQATATSFFPAKPLGCYGDGGAIFTDDAELARAMASIRAHGKGRHKYDIVRVGLNSRLDTLQAAILIEKLKIFRDEIERRQAVARRYAEALSGVAGVPQVPGGVTSVWAQYTLTVPALRRDALAAALEAQRIACAVYYPQPCHEQEAYRHYPVAAGGVSVSSRLSREVLSLPMHPYLAEADQQRVIVAVKKALSS